MRELRLRFLQFWERSFDLQRLKSVTRRAEVVALQYVPCTEVPDIVKTNENFTAFISGVSGYHCSIFLVRHDVSSQVLSRDFSGNRHVSNQNLKILRDLHLQVLTFRLRRRCFVLLNATCLKTVQETLSFEQYRLALKHVVHLALGRKLAFLAFCDVGSPLLKIPKYASVAAETSTSKRYRILKFGKLHVHRKWSGYGLVASLPLYSSTSLPKKLSRSSKTSSQSSNMEISETSFIMSWNVFDADTHDGVENMTPAVLKSYTTNFCTEQIKEVHKILKLYLDKDLKVLLFQEASPIFVQILQMFFQTKKIKYRASYLFEPKLLTLAILNPETSAVLQFRDLDFEFPVRAMQVLSRGEGGSVVNLHLRVPSQANFLVDDILERILSEMQRLQCPTQELFVCGDFNRRVPKIGTSQTNILNPWLIDRHLSSLTTSLKRTGRHFDTSVEDYSPIDHIFAWTSKQVNFEEDCLREKWRAWTPENFLSDHFPLAVTISPRK